jgi:hypothetical protein
MNISIIKQQNNENIFIRNFNFFAHFMRHFDEKTAETPTENYVVLTSNVKQLKPIFFLKIFCGVNFG